MSPGQRLWGFFLPGSSKMMRILVTCVLAIVLFAVATGCGGAGPQSTINPSGREKLEEIKAMLDTIAADHQKPPSKMADLGAVEPMIPFSANDIRSGELVYIWGTTISPGSAAVIAHEKNAPTAGGWVLLQDGTVKQMTAEEFSAAPKAGKK